MRAKRAAHSYKIAMAPRTQAFKQAKPWQDHCRSLRNDSRKAAAGCAAAHHTRNVGVCRYIPGNASEHRTTLFVVRLPVGYLLRAIELLQQHHAR